MSILFLPPLTMSKQQQLSSILQCCQYKSASPSVTKIFFPQEPYRPRRYPFHDLRHFFKWKTSTSKILSFSNSFLQIFQIIFQQMVYHLRHYNKLFYINTFSLSQ